MHGMLKVTPIYLTLTGILRQLFEANMSTLSGGITLVTSLGKDRLKTLNAIRAAFKTPEVMKMFAQKQPKALRLRLDQLRMDQKLGRGDEDRFKCVAMRVRTLPCLFLHSLAHHHYNTCCPRTLGCLLVLAGTSL